VPGRKSRSPYIHKTRRPRDSRTIPLWDETEQDNGTFYKCWHCGFICNDKRDSLGGESTRNAVSHTDFYPEGHPQPGEVGSGGSSELREGGAHSAGIMVVDSNTIRLMTPDYDGNTVEPVHYFDISTSGGCPQCGTMNWRGDY
jgi:hypothetical protein